MPFFDIVELSTLLLYISRDFDDFPFCNFPAKDDA